MLRTILVVPVLGLLLLLLGPLGLLAVALTGSAEPVYAMALPAVRVLAAVAGLRVRVHGRERVDPDRSYVFVANHQSNVDPPILFMSIRRHVRFLAKAPLFRVPVLGRVMRAAEFVPVYRKDRRRAIEAVDLAADALRRGQDFLVFPEGTRSPDGRLLPFKKGPFVMAIKASVPIIPVVVRGTREVQPKGSRTIRPGSIDVTFLEPIPTAGLDYEDRIDLRDRVRERMAAALEASGR